MSKLLKIFNSLKANLDSRKAQSGIPENYVITKIDPIRAGFTYSRASVCRAAERLDNLVSESARMWIPAILSAIFKDSMERGLETTNPILISTSLNWP